MAEDVTIQILSLFERLERTQKKDLAGLLNTIYGPGPHHEVLLRRIKGLLCTAVNDAQDPTVHIEWAGVVAGICEWIDNELNVGQIKEYIE